jgi:Mce-associated membrane protein
VDRTRLLVGGLVVALIASLVALVLVYRDRGEAEDRAASADALVDASVAAEKVARDAVTRMTTYSYRTIDDDFAWVDQVGTDRFQENFGGAVEDSVTYIKSLKAQAVGTVIDSSATAADADHVKVLLFVDQKIRSDQETRPGLDQPRVTMQMVREDGEWLVDEVQLNNLVSSQGSQ